MAEVVRYVNTASTAGSQDGTTSTPGNSGTAAYESLAKWDSSEATNLVTDGDTHVVHCSGTAADTITLMQGGWTTGASNGIQILGDNTTGLYSTSHYRIEYTTAATNDYCFRCDIDHVTIKNLQGFLTSTHTGVKGFDIRGHLNVLDSCITKASLSSTSTGRGIDILIGAGETCIVQNCLVYDYINGANVCTAYKGSGDADSILFVNCTAADSDDAFSCDSTDAIFKNCLAQDNAGSTFTVSYGTGSDYNYHDKAGSWGAVPNTQVSSTVAFEDQASDNYALDSTDTDAIDGGIGPASDGDVPAYDLAGNVRSGTTTDVGALMYVASGTIIPQIMHHRQQQE